MFSVVVALIPIVILETIILGKLLELPPRSMILSVAAANVTSTIAGILFVVLEASVPFPFLPILLVAGTEGYIVKLLLLLPFFALSVAIERPVLGWVKKGLDRDRLTRAVILANVGSYLLMAAFLIGRILKHGIVEGF